MESASHPARKVTVKITHPSPQKTYFARSPSPLKTTTSVSSPATTTFRPKAKVNSSATSNLVARKATSTVSSSAVSRTPSVKSTVSANRTTNASVVTPRSASPVRNASPVPRPRAVMTRGVTARANAQEGPRRQSLTSDAPYAPRNAASSSAFPPADVVDLSGDEAPVSAPSPRITAKLSNLAKVTNANDDVPPSPQLSSPVSAPFPLRAIPNRARVPSVSSSVSSSSSPFYPSAASTSGSPHLSPRQNPPSGYYQSFPRDDPIKYTARTNGFAAKVDPATIPLPTHSPPTSAVSFSSRSSLSHSSASVSYTTESGNSQRSGSGSDAKVNGNVRAGLENLLGFSGMLTPTADDDENETDESDDDDDNDDLQRRSEREGRQRLSAAEREVRAEAKSERKIADLEITNRSLLTINTSLEQTKHRQAKEIRDLRRKLRESRLVLPPREFRAVKHLPDDEDEDTDDDEDEDAEKAEKAEKEREEHDVTYARIKVILGGLLESGRRALETTPDDFVEPVKGKVAKVLSAYEMQEMEEQEPEPQHEGTTTGTDSKQKPASPPRVRVEDAEDDEDSLASEDEVEAMTIPRGSPSPAPSTPPPLRA